MAKKDIWERIKRPKALWLWLPEPKWCVVIFALWVVAISVLVAGHVIEVFLKVLGGCHT